MSTAELLSMLNTRSPDLKMLPPGFGSLSTIDIAHALAKVHSDGARLLGRVMYAQQPSRMMDLVRTVHAELKLIAANKRWKNTEPLWRLAAVAVDLYCFPKRCTKCDGIGQRQWGAKVVVCGRCKGSTWEPIQDRSLSRTLGMAPSTFIQIWHSRLGAALDILSKMDQDCIKGLNRALTADAP